MSSKSPTVDWSESGYLCNVDPNKFPWMSETIDLAKEKNFFQTHVTEYQSAGSLSWD
jgi:ribonucleotide reductase beta subunit family protein with ferritin-like domain